MADIKDSRHSTVSPLFNKMDALLARHRGAGGQDIPVLTDDASFLPVLTNAVTDDGLMFDPLEFQNNPPRFAPALSNKLPPPAPEKIVPLESVFLDLPMLDLDGLADNPLGLASSISPAVEVIPAVATNAPPRSADAFLHLENAIAEAHAAVPLMPQEEPEPEIEEIEATFYDPFDLEIDEPEAAAPVVQVPPVVEVLMALQARMEEEHEPDLPVLSDVAHITGQVPVAALPVMQEDEAFELSIDEPEIAVLEQGIDAPPSAYNVAHEEAPEEELTLVEDVPQLPQEASPPVVLHLEAEKDTSDAEAIPLIELGEEIEIGGLPGHDEEEHHLSLDEAPHDHHVILTLEHEDEHPTAFAAPEVIPVAALDSSLEPVPEPDPVVAAPTLTEAAINEITASVAAQIAVEISTEVAQLTRQHFSSMMNRFYSDSLRQLTEEISRDMEASMAPRITELVKDELRRQGLHD